MTKQRTIFKSNVSQRYKNDADMVEVDIDMDEELLNNTIKKWQKFKKMKLTQTRTIEEFIVECLTWYMEEKEKTKE